MGIRQFFSRRATRSSDEGAGTPNALDDFWYKALDFGRSVGGVQVTPESAQRLAAVYACQTAICESVAMLPAIVFAELDHLTKKRDNDNPLAQLLRIAPNQMMDSFQFFEAMQQNLLDEGNAYAHILRAKSGKILSLLPLDPKKIKVLTTTDGRLGYVYTDPQGQAIPYTNDDIFHLKYKTKDGLIGRSPVKVVAEAFGFGLSLQQHGIKVFENGAFLSGFLKSPTFFKDNEARKNFMESFKQIMGSRNAGKFGLLEGGIEYAPYSQNMKDAEFIEAQKFNTLDIARIYRVPPVMIQVTEGGMSYASIEQLSIIWTQYTIQPWVTRWERAIKAQLLKGRGEESTFLRFNVSALIRGDLKSRTESIILQLQNGLKTINEGRNMLDENPVDHEIGDEILVSHNLIPASMVGKVTSTGGSQGQVEPDPSLDPQPEPKKETKSTEDLAKQTRDRFLPLFLDLCGRIVRKEVSAATRAAKKPGFEAWAIEFLDSHRSYVSETLKSGAIAVRGELPANFEDLIDFYFAERRGSLGIEGALQIDDSLGWAEYFLFGFQSEVTKCQN